MLAASVAAAAAPVRAEISADRAKYCRAMMLEEHPTQMYGASGTAALQRDYFKQCINRQAKMDNRPELTTTGQSNQEGTSTIDGWTIDENRSPIDGRPQVTANLKAVGYDATMSLRCRENKTEAIFDLPSKLLGGRESVKVLIRFSDGIETMLSSSTNGQSFYAGSAEQFIEHFPDNGTISIRAAGASNRAVGGEFKLGNFFEVRQKIAKACNWPSEYTQNSTGPQSEQSK
jgi:hypothetical protein